MADFIDCTKNEFTFETLLRSLFAKDSDFGYFRVIQKTKGSEKPIDCNTHDDFVQLFNQALELSTDGFPALRICLTDFSGGSGLENADDCDTFKSLDLLSRMTFVYTSDGDVALNLANIT